MKETGLLHDLRSITPPTSSPDLDRAAIREIFRRSRIGSAKAPVIEQPKEPHFKTAKRVKVPPGLQKYAQAEKAIENDDLQLLLDQLDQGVRADDIYPDGSTLLHFAARIGKAGFVRVFLARGYSPDLLDDYSEGSCTPLYWAARHCHIEVMQVLIDYGANVNARACLTMSPLTAILRVADKLRTYHKEAIELLLNNGADVNQCWRIGHNPGRRSERLIEQLVSLRRISKIRRVINLGANLDCTLWHAATFCKNHQVKIVRLLLDNGARDSCGNAALLEAIFRNKPDIARELLRYEKRPLDQCLRARIRSSAQANRRRMRKLLAEYDIVIAKSESFICRVHPSKSPTELDCSIGWPRGDLDQLFNDRFDTSLLLPSFAPQIGTVGAFQPQALGSGCSTSVAANKPTTLPTPAATPTARFSPNHGIRDTKALALAAAQASCRQSETPSRRLANFNPELVLNEHGSHMVPEKVRDFRSFTTEDGGFGRIYSVDVADTDQTVDIISLQSTPVHGPPEEDTVPILEHQSAVPVTTWTILDSPVRPDNTTSDPCEAAQKERMESMIIGCEAADMVDRDADFLPHNLESEVGLAAEETNTSTNKTQPIRVWVKGRCFNSGNRHLV